MRKCGLCGDTEKEAYLAEGTGTVVTQHGWIKVIAGVFCRDCRKVSARKIERAAREGRLSV